MAITNLDLKNSANLARIATSLERISHDVRGILECMGGGIGEAEEATPEVRRALEFYMGRSAESSDTPDHGKGGAE